MDRKRILEIDIAAKKACIEDLLVAIEFYEQEKMYHMAAECTWRIKKAEHAIKYMEGLINNECNRSS
ncbi:hypothetical protein I6G82_08520 [Lysinibacillus macroides]|uniref:Uncharacterized protein n=1 Tax=Lysinibacillus macroides TaxID=33935 RepID=A0A0M9DHG1_9BACI|nr:hypothetical protein [Lysinibacillus macroides]KOY81548.1 hypothetical protein ADM90_14165 [Lysinibacillus macroides]QPR69613.1 hypothetical protein I6G82_08520 [Lysinibacillus macroides]